MGILVLSLPNLLIAQLYILSAFLDYKDRTGLLGLIEANKIPYPKIAMNGGILLKLIAGIGLLLAPLVYFSAIALIIFTLIATFIFHPFWKKSGSEYNLELITFSMCIAVIGGLFALI